MLKESIPNPRELEVGSRVLVGKSYIHPYVPSTILDVNLDGEGIVIWTFLFDCCSGRIMYDVYAISGKGKMQTVPLQYLRALPSIQTNQPQTEEKQETNQTQTTTTKTYAQKFAPLSVEYTWKRASHPTAPQPTDFAPVTFTTNSNAVPDPQGQYVPSTPNFGLVSPMETGTGSFDNYFFESLYDNTTSHEISSSPFLL